MTTTQKTTPKATNYDDDTLTKMLEIYKAAGTELSEAGNKARQEAVDKIQKLSGKSVHSIRSKLGALKVYIKPYQPVTKKADRVTKEDMITSLEEIAGEDEGFFNSLSGANKAVLAHIIDLQKAVNAASETTDSETTDSETA